ncbi:MAG: bamB 2 [Acidimicrobiaceae bacterium]|nr:bamB 2 [Acidimicrobiaceae bacterium]
MLHRCRFRSQSRRSLTFRLVTSAVVAASLGGTTLAALVATSAKADTLQMSGDNLETGWYPSESQLAPSAVTSGDFGQLFSTSVVGHVYAQPLVSQGTLLAATEQNDVYGLDPSTGVIKWSDNFGAPWNPLQQLNCGDLTPYMGITGTPVIDQATDTAYFVADTGTGPNGSAVYYMEAVNVATGATAAGWPASGVLIQGSADDDPGTVFDAEYEAQRPGLVLVNGVVYAAFGAHCDLGNWTGWLVGVSTSTASITTMWATETGIDLPNGGGGKGGVWQSGGAPVIDGQGNIYVATGNGTLPSPGSGTRSPEPVNYGEAVVKLSTSGGKLRVLDWFIPWDAPNLNIYDGDLGSGGPVALPASMGTPQEPDVMLQIGKEGELYSLNMNALGGYQYGTSAEDAVPSESGPYGGVWSKPAVWPGQGGYVYIPTDGSTGSTPFNANGGSLDVFQRMVSASGAVWFKLVGSTANNSSVGPFEFGSGAPVVTSNGTASGSALVWVIHDIGSGVGELEAYDPIPQNAGSDGALQQVWHSSTFTTSTFAEPGVDSGRVYAGTSDGTVLGFGLLEASPPALVGDDLDFSPATVSQSAAGTATFTATAQTTVTSFSLTGSAFAIGTPDQPLPASLSAGQSITVPITFTANAIGELTGTLTANVGSGPATIALAGEGLIATGPLSAAPAEADFAPQLIGGPMVSQVVTFSNVSTNPLTVTGFTAPALPFAVPDPPGNATIAPNGTVSFTVDFSPPGSSGNFDHVFGGVATLKTSAGDFGVPVSGSAQTPPQINISSTALDFGDVQVGQSRTVNFYVGNQGGVGLDIMASTPPTTNGFSALSSLPAGASIGGNSTVEESVQFTPTATGPLSSTWVIEGNDGSGPQTITMTGTGVAAPGSGGAATSQGSTTVTSPGPTAVTTAPAPTPLVTPEPAARPVVRLMAAPVAVRANVARLELSCAISTCVGRLELTITESVRDHTSSGFRKHSKVVNLGAISYRVSAGSQRALSVRLDKAGRTALASSLHHRLKVTVRINVGGGVDRSYQVLLT